MLKLLTIGALLIGAAFGAESSTSESSSSGESSSSSESSSSESSSESSSSESSSESSTTKSAVETTTTSLATTTTSSATTTYAAQKYNDLTSNYFYSTFDTSHFAYAIDQCTAISVGGQTMMATCVDENTLSVKEYSVSGCTGDYTEYTYTSKNATFYCGGVSSYAKIVISVTGCSDTAVTYDVYSALHVCSNATSTIWTSVYCSSSPSLYGEIQYYYSNTCADSAYLRVAKMNSTCQALFKTSSNIQVYGEIGSCYVPATATTGTPATTASSPANMYNIQNVVVLLFVAMFVTILRL